MARCLSQIVFTALFAGSVWAQLPAGPGKAEVERLCKNCHEPEMATSERMSRDAWTKTLEKMIESGAEGTGGRVQPDPRVSGEELRSRAGETGKRQQGHGNGTGERLDDCTYPGRGDHSVPHRKGNFKTIEDLKKVPGLDAREGGS
jgi:competence protein ComEA